MSQPLIPSLSPYVGQPTTQKYGRPVSRLSFGSDALKTRQSNLTYYPELRSEYCSKHAQENERRDHPLTLIAKLRHLNRFHPQYSNFYYRCWKDLLFQHMIHACTEPNPTTYSGLDGFLRCVHKGDIKSEKERLITFLENNVDLVAETHEWFRLWSQDILRLRPDLIVDNMNQVTYYDMFRTYIQNVRQGNVHCSTFLIEMYAVLSRNFIAFRSSKIMHPMQLPESCFHIPPEKALLLDKSTSSDNSFVSYMGEPWIVNPVPLYLSDKDSEMETIRDLSLKLRVLEELLIFGPLNIQCNGNNIQDVLQRALGRSELQRGEKILLFYGKTKIRSWELRGPTINVPSSSSPSSSPSLSSPSSSTPLVAENTLREPTHTLYVIQGTYNMYTLRRVTLADWGAVEWIPHPGMGLLFMERLSTSSKLVLNQQPQIPISSSSNLLEGVDFGSGSSPDISKHSSSSSSNSGSGSGLFRPSSSSNSGTGSDSNSGLFKPSSSSSSSSSLFKPASRPFHQDLDDWSNPSEPPEKKQRKETHQSLDWEDWEDWESWEDWKNEKSVSDINLKNKPSSNGSQDYDTAPVQSINKDSDDAVVEDLLFFQNLDPRFVPLARKYSEFKPVSAIEYRIPEEKDTKVLVFLKGGFQFVVINDIGFSFQRQKSGKMLEYVYDERRGRFIPLDFEKKSSPVKMQDE